MPLEVLRTISIYFRYLPIRIRNRLSSALSPVGTYRTVPYTQGVSWDVFQTSNPCHSLLSDNRSKNSSIFIISLLSLKKFHKLSNRIGFLAVSTLRRDTGTPGSRFRIRISLGNFEKILYPVGVTSNRTWAVRLKKIENLVRLSLQVLFVLRRTRGFLGTVPTYIHSYGTYWPIFQLGT